MTRNNIMKLVLTVGVSELAGVIGAFFTAPSVKTWYVMLVKPALNPPAWVFGQVWTALYFLMGVALFLVWREGLSRKDVKIALALFVVQLALNVWWPIIFFGKYNPSAAFVEIIFLWCAIFATIIFFRRISRAAGLLLVPYILWVSFAAYLNYAVWMLNP